MCAASPPAVNPNDPTISTGSPTKDRIKTRAAAAAGYGSLNDQAIQAMKDVVARAPGAAPDVTDPATHLAAEAQARSLLTQRGRKSTFLGGASLDASSPLTGTKSLLGS